jgi:hypothetical protein
MTVFIQVLVCVCLLAAFIRARTDISEWVWFDDTYIPIVALKKSPYLFVRHEQTVIDIPYYHSLTGFIAH